MAKRAKKRPRGFRGGFICFECCTANAGYDGWGCCATCGYDVVYVRETKTVRECIVEAARSWHFDGDDDGS